MAQQPLAFRMRPTNLSEIVGQQQIVGKNHTIWRMVQANRLSSMILFGPPGTGKTSIASAIAGSAKLPFRTINAAIDGKKELQAIIEETKIQGNIVLLLDEIHRLDKVKQDFLLPFLENGKIILIGATTENPYLSVTPAIRSRVQIFEVQSLSTTDIIQAIDRALVDKERGLGDYQIKIDNQAKQFLAERSNGDLRTALNSLEIAVLSTTPTKDNVIEINQDIIEESINQKSLAIDKNGEGHYSIISAFQKSIRGSDTDAALYYLGLLIEGGDMEIAARRLYVIAYEDIGLANPPAAQRAVTAVDAALKLGLPEARIPLANAVIELALSPKSNSAYMAINQILEDIRTKKTGKVPNHLRNNANWGKKDNDPTRVNYLYPHEFANDWVAQQYLPDELMDKEYFSPKGNTKFEQQLFETYKTLKKNQHDGLQ